MREATYRPPFKVLPMTNILMAYDKRSDAIKDLMDLADEAQINRSSMIASLPNGDRYYFRVFNHPSDADSIRGMWFSRFKLHGNFKQRTLDIIQCQIRNIA